MAKEELLKKVNSFCRKAYIPLTNEADGKLSASKFAGIPWLNQNEEWPKCPNCRNPLNFFMQLNLAELPNLPKGCKPEGLIQLFYCTNQDPHCESECEAFFPFSKSVIVRLVSIADEAPQQLQKSAVHDAFPPRSIIKWQEQEDFPNSEELAENHIELSEDEDDLYYDLELTLFGDKLLGWPAWVQGVEYPNCPECGETMHLLFQLDSETNLPYMFGDLGCGHITICPNHQHQLGFGWACS